jgi:Fur family zinc uptake transcriptional regulator
MLDCQDHEVCIESAMREAESICQEKGLRFTDLRREVLRLIWLSHVPAKAYDILENLKGKEWSAKPPTVYRALDFLLETGLVHKLDSINAYIGRSHPRDHNGCYFLICTDCNEAKECCSSELSDAIELAWNKNSFKPKKITLEVFGQCSACR